MNGVWYPGDTLQAGIGQSDNLFTPLQLANYVATVAGGGTRYQPHLIKSVKTYQNGQTLSKTEPKAVTKIDISKENYDAIMKGMRSVTEDGTASNVFGNYPIAVGGKTGTAQVPNGSANGIFVAFAPYDNPKIAVAIVIEHGAHGNMVAPIARDIFDVYFGENAAAEKVLPEKVLIP
jgi:penicillin-binding protein 2